MEEHGVMPEVGLEDLEEGSDLSDKFFVDDMVL